MITTSSTAGAAAAALPRFASLAEDVAAAASKYQCSVCKHVYDPAKDGGGKPFEQLPDSWKCPVCGAPKSAYKPVTLEDGSKGHNNSLSSSSSVAASRVWSRNVCC